MNTTAPFDWSQDIILENERVLIRSLKSDDAQYLMEFSIHEPELWTYSLISGVGKENLENYIKVALQGKENQNQFPFIVFDKNSKKYAGSTRFYDIQLSNKTLQLGYTWYGKQFQGTGLNKHCKYLLLQYAFETLGMERVEFRADASNERSIAAMKSIGCTVEGILRNTATNTLGKRRDSIVLSILRNEWLESVKQNLETKLK